MNTPSRSAFALWRLCAWAGPVFLVGYVASWAVLGMNLPPLSPKLPLAELYAHYVDHSIQLRLAYVLSVFFIPFYMVFSSVISRVMRTIEGDDGTLAIVEQMGGATTVVVGMVAGICWLTAAFRVEERRPEIVRTLHDFGWLFFDTTYMVTGVQMLAMSIVFLSDRRAQPLMPRFLSWYAIFVVTTFLPLSLLPFFYSGPFAWSGVFCYWISLGSWFLWVLLLCIHLFKAIDRLEQDQAAETGRASEPSMPASFASPQLANP